MGAEVDNAVAQGEQRGVGRYSVRPQLMARGIGGANLSSSTMRLPVERSSATPRTSRAMIVPVVSSTSAPPVLPSPSSTTPSSMARLVAESAMSVEWSSASSRRLHSSETSAVLAMRRVSSTSSAMPSPSPRIIRLPSWDSSARVSPVAG